MTLEITFLHVLTVGLSSTP